MNDYELDVDGKSLGEHLPWVKEFVERHRAFVGAVVVHCEAGASRSPAVAAALARWLRADERPFLRQHQPNWYVYRLLCACLEATA
jgi:protein-tyrosine phosphatase